MSPNLLLDVEEVNDNGIGHGGHCSDSCRRSTNEELGMVDEQLHSGNTCSCHLIEIDGALDRVHGSSAHVAPRSHGPPSADPRARSDLYHDHLLHSEPRADPSCSFSQNVRIRLAERHFDNDVGGEVISSTGGGLSKWPDVTIWFENELCNIVVD